MMRLAPLGLVCALFTAVPGTATLAQQPFALDTTFRVSFPTWYVASVLPLPDGKVIVSGQLHYPGAPFPQIHCGLARLNADGSWDDSFPWSNLGQGKITPWEDRFYLGTAQTVRRILFNGTNDATFIGMNTNPFFSSNQGGDYHVFPDGRLVMSGLHTLSDTVHGFTGLHNFIWFTNTGHLDTTRTHRRGNGEISTFKEVFDGKFIASGSCTVYDGRPTSWIQRMHPDGSLDTTFFTGVNWGRAYTYLPLADGRVYAGGLFRIAGMADTLHLVRFMPDGSLDPTFNNHLPFIKGELSGFGPVVTSIQFLTPDILLVLGRFTAIGASPRMGIALVDTEGEPIDLGEGVGCGPFTYMGFTYGTLNGATFLDDDMMLVHGTYYGFQDGSINDPAQRFVSRLHVGDINLSAPAAPTIAILPLLHIHPNPATLSGAEAWVAFDYDLLVPPKDASLVVRDLTGRTVYRQVLREQQQQLVWDTRQTAPGTYTATLLSGGRALRTEKLILQP